MSPIFGLGDDAMFSAETTNILPSGLVDQINKNEDVKESVVLDR